MTHFILGAAMLVVGVIVGCITELNVRSGLQCYQSVVHNGKAQCAIYVNKELIR